ncbi:hypothetical protein PP836_004707 [Salmonella enterica]|nr:hypothetical protein [Salmonella enterica]HCM1889874.1 hypothetical protein [Salmonella enterica subsp. diarizonae serovar 57:c:z]
MLMSKAAYAKHCGVSRQTIYDRIERGEVVMSGSKIDVGATEKKLSPRCASGSRTPPASDDTDEIRLTWGKIAENIRLLDGVAEPANSLDELVQRVYDAAALFKLEVRNPSPEFVVYELYDPGQNAIAFTAASGIAEIEVLMFLRWVALTGTQSGSHGFEPLEEVTVSKRALAALSEPFTERAKEIYEPED